MDICVIGHTAKDKIIEIEKFPDYMKPHLKNAIRASQCESTFGRSYAQILEWLGTNAVATNYGYGGRAPHVAYQLSRLGHMSYLISDMGEDADEDYKGLFFGGSFIKHLKNSGVKLNGFVLERDCIIDERLRTRTDMENAGVVIVPNTKITEIICLLDKGRNDMFLFDDEQKTSTVMTKYRPVPVGLIRQSDALFVTSGSTDLNARTVDVAHYFGKPIFWDVGFFDYSDEYARRIVPRVSYITGNEAEIKSIRSATDVPNHKIFEHNKNEGTAIVHATGRVLGPVEIKKTGTPIGCCDGFSAGVFAYYLTKGFRTDRDLENAARVGLSISAAVYEVVDVQSGMPRSVDELRVRLKRDWKEEIL